MKEKLDRIFTWFLIILIFSMLIGGIFSLFGGNDFLMILLVYPEHLPFLLVLFLRCLPIVLFATFALWAVTRLRKLHHEVVALKLEVSRLKEELSRT